jgi:hypothetical protein
MDQRIYELQNIISGLLRERRSLNERIERQTSILVSHTVRNGILTANAQTLQHQNADLSELFSLHSYGYLLFHKCVK